MNARSVDLPYDEVYYQRLEDDEPDLAYEISLAIKRVIDSMGKGSSA